MCWHMSRAPPNEWQNIVIRGLIGIPLCQLEQLRDESNQSVQDCSVVVQNMLQKLKRLGRLPATTTSHSRDRIGSPQRGNLPSMSIATGLVSFGNSDTFTVSSALCVSCG
jgi:hypothetical protein